VGLAALAPGAGDAGIVLHLRSLSLSRVCSALPPSLSLTANERVRFN
jgi:hypothetical protein